MQLHPVQSSRIKALGYDEDTWTCYVQFQPTKREPKGTVYAYANVPPEMYRKFLAAKSKGRYFGAHLADHESHPELRLGEPHTPASKMIDAASEVLMFRPAESDSPGQGGRKGKPPLRVDAQGYLANSEQLRQLARERELLIEFFRPMRESTFAAYRAVVEKEEEALAQFQAAETALVLQGTEPRAGGSRTGK